MATHALKGRKKPKSDIRSSLKANVKKRGSHKNDNIFKNMKERRAALRAEAEAAKSPKGKPDSKAEARSLLKAAKRKGATISEDLEVSATAAGQAEAPALEETAPRPPKLSKKELKMQEELVKQHVALYPGGERVLLVGEGNFSFARALARRLGKAAGIYATAFDSEAVLNKKYPDAAACRKEVENLGGMTLVGVDATHLHKVREFQGAFNKVVWNFPHIGGGEKDVEKSIAEHRKLLAKFFASAVQCLDPELPSAIHVAVKACEPYKSWKVVQVARAACEEVTFSTAVPFALSAWSGYSHRRTAGFSETFSKKDSEELAKGAKVYVFVKRKEPE